MLADLTRVEDFDEPRWPFRSCAEGPADLDHGVVRITHYSSG